MEQEGRAAREAERAEAREEARTEMEQEIVGIWEEVLGVKGLGINEDFFDLGGHSLLGARLIARINDAFRVNLSLHSIFQSPTIAGLSQAIVQNQIAQAGADQIDEILRELGLSESTNLQSESAH